MSIDSDFAGAPSEPAFMHLKVAAKRRLAADIYLFELRHPEGHELPPFTAGAHLTVQLPNGMKRNYSLCSDPRHRDFYQIAVKRDAGGRGGSISLVDGVQTADNLWVSAPRNNFEITDRAEDYIFVAGGIGITPIMSMMRHLKDTGRERFKLYYCTRDPQHTAFLPELAESGFKDKVQIHYDHGDRSKAFDFWNIFEKPSKAHIYCCGPKGLMDSVRDTSGHWPSGSVHFESFGAEQAHAENRPFNVRLQKAGKILHIAKDKSLLDVLRENGHYVSSSCESGTCGSCRTRLVSGVADHRDMVLADGEKSTQIMVCVSRAKSNELVLDL